MTRVAGFARTLVLAGAVGTTDLGDIYQTANTVPNIVFEIVAGGALATVVVPLLAGAVAAGDRRQVAGVASALLTWTVALLIPIGVLVAVFAAPIVTLVAGAHDPASVAVGARMLRVFAIQLPLYGVGTVLTGVLHAHHRFAWPVLAPLLSSMAVIGTYVVFAAVDGPGTTVASVTPAGELILSIGTTLGVAVLTLCLVVPVRSLRLGLRPRLALGGDVRRRAFDLAGAAVVIVAAQQLLFAYFIRLANGGTPGAVVVLAIAHAVFLMPWAVLAVPISTPTFPILAEAAASGRRSEFDATLARTVRAAVLAGGLGVALLVGLAGPAGRLLSVVTATHPAAHTLTVAMVAFAPGLLGYGLFALLTRALNASGEARRAAAGAVLGWGSAAAAALVLAAALDPSQRVAALGAANSIGMTVLGAGLLTTVYRRRGAAALAGLGRTLLVSLTAAGVAGAAGWVVGSRLVTTLTPGGVGPLLAGILAGVVVVMVFLGIAGAADGGDVRPQLARLARLVRRRATSEVG